jgi:dihydroorotase
MSATPANLKMVMEHITTAEAVEFVTNAPSNVAATITPQHLLYNRNSLFQVACSVFRGRKTAEVVLILPPLP